MKQPTLKEHPLRQVLLNMIEVTNKQGEQIVNLVNMVLKQEDSIKSLVEYVEISQKSLENLTAQIDCLKSEVCVISQRSNVTVVADTIRQNDLDYNVLLARAIYPKEGI